LWLFVIAALFLGDFLLQTYCRVFGSLEFGYATQIEEGRRVVQSVIPDSSAERAGLVPGDRILALEGRDIQQHSGGAARIFRANLETHRPYRFDIERNGRRLELALEAERARPLQSWGDFVIAGWQFASLILLAIAFLIAFSRPFEPAARSGSLALAMLSVGLFFTNLPPGYASIWRSLPHTLGIPLWIPHICVYLFGPILLTFFVIFPQPLFRCRWPWIVIWLPALLLLPLNFRMASLTVYSPDQAYAHLPPLWVDRAQVTLIGLYGLAAAAVLAANFIRLKDSNERRRIRLLLIGGAAGVVPGLFRLVMMGIFPESAVSSFLMYKAVPDMLIVVIFLLFPICFAYSILRHRLLDIRVIIRQGIRYSLARGTLLSLVPALGIILALDLTLNNHLTIADIFSQRGWIYAGLGGLALIAIKWRKPWLEKLDKRFFREQYNSQKILAEVLEDIREAKSFERVAPRVVARIEAALHPEFVSVMVRRPAEDQYHPLSAVPSGHTTPPLDADSKLVAMARVLGKPLEVLMADTTWLEGRLPQEEIEFARGARIDLFVPIGTASGSADAFLALGIKRSEEPYTKEDQELMEAIASSFGLLFDQWIPAPVAVTDAFDVCPECGCCYDTGKHQCPQDGSTLILTQLPRTLVGRYHLERRLGRGGMGTVYEATDSGLERRVAVKVIRDQWVGSAEAAQRFKREARAAAGFTHPNVVTVHDYGAAEERHAFLVMELLEGSTLRDELKRRSRLDPVRTTEIFQGVCAGVDAAHRRQIIHRDLKPENIFLSRSEGFDSPEEKVKILDFGIAKILIAPSEVEETLTGFETSAGVLVGTIGYLSPEQLLGGSPGVLWDLWALSVVAYEMLTGRLPFARESTETWRNAVLAGEFTPLDVHRNDPPASWQAFFADCFATDSLKRPQSAADFFRRLEKTLLVP